jgi:predicted RNA binding protein YcfA (HicA-like mRNA interferase family)
MPSLPIISGEDAAKAVEKAGWKFVRQKGSHMIFIKEGCRRPLPIPNHDELDRGTLRSIIRQAGLTIEEFTELLK